MWSKLFKGHKCFGLTILFTSAVFLIHTDPYAMRKKKAGKEDCIETILPIKDALALLSGKWKLSIIIALSFGGKRFTELAREIPGITDSVLSKELKELEANQLIGRTNHDAFPPITEYHITPHGLSLEKVMMELKEWGLLHRKLIMHS